MPGQVVHDLAATGGEDLVNYLAGAAMTAACAGTAGMDIVACTDDAVLLGTEENPYDYLSTGGSRVQDPEGEANKFWFNEAITLGSPFLPGGNNFMERPGWIS